MGIGLTRVLLESWDVDSGLYNNLILEGLWVCWTCEGFCWNLANGVDDIIRGFLQQDPGSGQGLEYCIRTRYRC